MLEFFFWHDTREDRGAGKFFYGDSLEGNGLRMRIANWCPPHRLESFEHHLLSFFFLYHSTPSLFIDVWKKSQLLFKKGYHRLNIFFYNWVFKPKLLHKLERQTSLSVSANLPLDGTNWASRWKSLPDEDTYLNFSTDKHVKLKQPKIEVVWLLAA